MTAYKKAQDIPLRKRGNAYVIILIGYFFYCYNFAVVDYVRPYLVEVFSMTLNETALLYTALSLGTLIGAISIARLTFYWGCKNTLIFITALNGIGTIILTSFSSFFPWLFMRFVIGLSLGGYNVAAVTLMVTLFPPHVRGRLQSVNASSFAVAIMVLGALGAFFGDAHWKNIIWFGGIPPLIIAVCMWFIVPNDKALIPYGEEIESRDLDDALSKKGSWLEMFQHGYARFTIICVVISGLNFCGYQFFSGFVTTYLRDIRGFDAQVMGLLVATIGAGSFIGGLSWGYIADKLGRRFNALGFILTGIFICLYFIAPTNVFVLGLLGFCYGAALACTYTWVVYFSEIFPVHLRPMGVALFHSGRIISFFAPSVVALISESYGLTTGMALAPVVFIIAAVLWYRLPETLASCRYYKGYKPVTIST